jgi:glyoxylase-like metal-dependent hydrolase (beta-lactamase superfamily II)
MHIQLSRRVFLRSASLAAVAMALPITVRSGRAAQVVQTSQAPRNAGFYRFKLGNFELVSISDGTLAVPAAVFAGNATPEEVAAVLQAGFQSETLTPDCNVLYVNTGQNQVLIDTGSGSMGNATAGKLLDNLRVAQIDPAAIDTVIITHAHGDHVGGLLDQAGAAVFTNARFHISKTEYDFWMQPEVSLPKIGVDAEFVQSVIDTARRQLGAIQPQLTTFEMNQEIIPGVSAIPAPGHTPGQVALQIVSGEMSMVHTADVVHTHTLNLWHPEWKPIFDADPDQASTTRQQLLAKIAAERLLMYSYHFPFPGLGHIRPREAGGFTWEPVSWQFEA